MSELIAVFTQAQHASLRGARPAWIEQERSGGFTYYREDHNTPWLGVDADGCFLGMSDLMAILAPLRDTESFAVALVRIENKESIDSALARALSLPAERQPSTLKINSAIFISSETGGRRAS
jgi:hypothetical protein